MKFDTTKDIKDQIRAAIYQSVGQASMCWEHPDKAGTFLSDEASKVADELFSLIDDKMEVNPKL